MGGIVIVGGGQAGVSLAFKLRDLGHDGEVTLIGEEPDPPYQRPPLSKAYLLGEMTRERLYLRPAEAYDDKGISLRTDARVTGIDPKAKTLNLGGETLAYDHLALTTGAVPRRLPVEMGGDLDGLYPVRTLADIDRMEPEFREGAKVLIIGGGYIGLEAAAVAAKKGLQVLLIEAGPRILARVAAPETSDYFRAAHEAKGVEIRENTALLRLLGDGSVTGAELSDGSQVEADFAILGIGIDPDTALAETAGLALENGIKTDARGATSVPGIWAAGDCASFPYWGRRIRLESVQNAIDQAEAVAANILGAKADYVPHPWFWSDQYDIKLQIAGLSDGYGHVVVRETAKGRSHWYFKDARLIALDAMNDPRAYMVGKRLIEAEKSPDPAIIADGEADLRPLLKA
ncbi:MAG: FAD-dependent oxidoreductase [Pseudomonadota bacterium]